MIKVVLADDHILLRQGLANLIEDFGNYKVLFQADNGKDFLEKLDRINTPDIVLMDINMPVMDGYETALWLKENIPGIKVLALSMYDDEMSIIRMFRAAVKGYILKDCDPAELKQALNAVMTKGFYYSDLVTGVFVNSVTKEDEGISKVVDLSSKEVTFLKLCSTEMTYKEIAGEMNLSPRTIDGYRDELCVKLGVKTRIGLVMYAIRSGIIKI
ncbi:MAG TPA: response regulator transcription factor [Chitinophagaceae bacterium]|nr:response regulator transcription factor [Chitinophagaceae bacterium]